MFKWYLADFFYAISLKGQNINPAILSVNLNSNNPQFTINLGSLYAAKNQPSKAIFYLNQSIHTSPFEINFYKQISTAYTNLAIHNLTYLKQAVSSLQTATNLAPTDPVLPYQLGNLYKAINDPKQTEKYYQQALNLKPNYDHAMMELGQVYFEQKKYSEAKKLFDSAVKINPKNFESLPSFPPHL